MVHHSVTRTQHNFTQPVGLLRPYSIHGSLALVIMFFSRLQQVMIQSILRQCVFWEITLSMDQGHFLQSDCILGFIPVICISMSLSQSINPYSYLTQVDDAFLGTFNSCASWTLNNCSVSSLFKASMNAM